MPPDEECHGQGIETSNIAKQEWFSDDLGLKSPITPKIFEQQRVTPIVARVFGRDNEPSGSRSTYTTAPLSWYWPGHSPRINVLHPGAGCCNIPYSQSTPIVGAKQAFRPRNGNSVRLPSNPSFVFLFPSSLQLLQQRDAPVAAIQARLAFALCS